MHNKADGDYEILKEVDPKGRCISGVLGNEISIQAVESHNCLKIDCKDGVVTVTIGKQEIVCSSQGKKILNADLGTFLMCPDPVLFCKKEEERCPDDCNDHGRCLKDKTCWCYSGYTGESCGSRGNFY